MSYAHSTKKKTDPKHTPSNHFAKRGKPDLHEFLFWFIAIELGWKETQNEFYSKAEMVVKSLGHKEK